MHLHLTPPNDNIKNIGLAYHGGWPKSLMCAVVRLCGQVSSMWTAVGWVTTRVLDDEYKPTVLTLTPDTPNNPFFRGLTNKNKLTFTL